MTHLSQTTTIPKLEGTKLLLVEDEPDMAEFFLFILREIESEVVHVASVAEAWCWLLFNIPDAIICDLLIPEVDGLEFVRGIRAFEDERIRRIPVIAITSYIRSFNADHAIQAGFDRFLPKLCPVEELAKAVLELTR